MKGVDYEMMKILLVDDDPFALELFATQLRSLGMQDIRTCPSAASALALLAHSRSQSPFDLIFCDLNMPETDGVELLRQLAREAFKGGVVLVSGEDDRTLKTVGHLAELRGLELIGTLTKPVAIERLEQVLMRARAVVEPLVSRAKSRRYTPQSLQHAIADGQLLCHYQPKVALADGRVVGVEALVRWQHPDDGLVFPDQFIGMAEDNALIGDLTWVVLDSALRQARRWHEAGYDLSVAVNVSMEGLVDLGFPDAIGQAVAAAGLPAWRLSLEVTESRLSIDRLALLDIVSRLRLKRVGVSIDDFGTGHSSLAQLRDIPFNELKLDRGFVDGVAASAELQAIVGGSMMMARHLGLTVTAEGVEQREDWDYLRESSCDLAQGYLIARPMPGEELTGWVDAWRKQGQRPTAPEE